MPEGNPMERSPQSNIIDDPAISEVRKLLMGMEPTEENIRQAINEAHENLSIRMGEAQDAVERGEIDRQMNLLYNRAEDIIFYFQGAGRVPN
jgi:hypothetical protein